MIVKSLEDTKKYANQIIKKLGNHKFILLDGDLGSGKTTLTKFIAEALGEKKVVVSPTFNIMKIYDKFIHIDAYKLNGTLEEYEDYFGDKIVIIEWWKNLKENFNENSLKIKIYKKNNERIFEEE
ncbi:MAG: tRNA (adenosine(37)-N6)-threonylcarbamoyltransferase complex ATPase subunit type 1 TsaE [Mycoplasma sp.]|nr:tRNA (adenosine(37)-N6)-threonylcarbamoyltransferase complex ATPase subunit type 1 TsaE [Mycoplasma sp.]